MEAQQRLEIFGAELPQHQPRGPHGQSRSKRDLHNAMLQPEQRLSDDFSRPATRRRRGGLLRQPSVQTDAATRAAPDGWNMIV
jgi:hypothetical protein